MGIEEGPDDTLDVSESLDSDEVRNEDGDDVVDPPDHWSEADRFGTTLREAEQGESLDQRLAEEEPDVPRPVERTSPRTPTNSREPRSSTG